MMIDIQSLLNNPILQGGALLGIFGYLYTPIKSFLRFLKEFIRRQFLYTLYFTNKDSAFAPFEKWLSKQKVSYKSKQSDFIKPEINIAPEEVHEANQKRSLIKILGPGIHFFWYQKSFVILYKSKSVADLTGEAKIQYWIHIFSFKRNILDILLDEINSLSDKPINQIHIYHNRYDHWSNTPIVTAYDPKNTTVIFPSNFEHLIKDLEWFLNSKDFFIKHNIPYKRCYLLYGPPGNGKTTFIKHLASTYNKDIYNLEFQSGSESFSSNIRHTSGNMCVIEDIDRYYDKNKNTFGKDFSCSQLFNVLDGINSPDNSIFILTANNPENLPKGLLRSGRIDQKLLFHNPSVDNLIELYYKIYGQNISENDIQKIYDSKYSFSIYKTYFLENIKTQNLVFDKENWKNFLLRNEIEI